jgi:hypothetical protein
LASKATLWPTRVIFDPRGAFNHKRISSKWSEKRLASVSISGVSPLTASALGSIGTLPGFIIHNFES